MGNGNSAPVSRQLRTILTAGTLGALTDRELLQQFRADRGPSSEAAFTALVERHGSLVLGVCQSVLDNAFGSASEKSSYYRPWFELVDSEHLDVSYRENLGDMLVRPERDKLGNRILPKKLARLDVILLAEGWADHISDNIIYYLNEFVKSGKRLIVAAAPGSSDSLRGANSLLEPYGMRMINDQWNREVDAKRTIFDPLATSVRTLGFYHPAGIEILDPSVATILAPAPTGKSGLVAVARPGKGEVVAIGLSFVSSWLGEEAEGFDNVQMLRNLLTKDVKQ